MGTIVECRNAAQIEYDRIERVINKNERFLKRTIGTDTYLLLSLYGEPEERGPFLVTDRAAQHNALEALRYANMRLDRLTKPN